jgi:hypothetical protein
MVTVGAGDTVGWTVAAEVGKTGVGDGGSGAGVVGVQEDKNSPSRSQSKVNRFMIYKQMSLRTAVGGEATHSLLDNFVYKGLLRRATPSSQRHIN